LPKLLRLSGGMELLDQDETSFIAQYRALIDSGAIEADPAQAEVARAFAALETNLQGYNPRRRSGLLGRLFADKKTAPRGLYVHGSVGRGKTMLMDLFFEASRVAHKRRAHFHEFMADIHERMATFRQLIASGETSETDPVRLTAAAVFEEAWLLCFDEFHVTDIADAMILGRLFERLFELGTVVVATSNVAPDDLYKGGLNRALFLPFIAQLKTRMEVARLDARTDFRLEKLAGMRPWYTPVDAAADAAVDKAWRRITGGAPVHSLDLKMKGRILHVPRTVQGVARFSFAQLCSTYLGASDYLRLAHEFHTIVIDHIPVMTHDNRNEAKRFITLIDTLYDNAVKLIASAVADPDHLYRAHDGIEAAEFIRTASRLTEMGSDSYLALPHGGAGGLAIGSREGLAET
jgi:cell division protein ZapE